VVGQAGVQPKEVGELILTPILTCPTGRIPALPGPGTQLLEQVIDLVAASDLRDYEQNRSTRDPE
jgi:hypothetical protein